MTDINCDHCGRTVKAVPGDHSCKGGSETCPNAHGKILEMKERIKQLEDALKQQKIICGCGDHINCEADFFCRKCNKWFCTICGMEGDEAGGTWICRDCLKSIWQDIQ